MKQRLGKQFKPDAGRRKQQRRVGLDRLMIPDATASSPSLLSVVYVLRPEPRGLSTHQRIAGIPKVLNRQTGQWTITRFDYFANSRARSSPMASALPLPPSTWLRPSMETKVRHRPQSDAPTSAVSLPGAQTLAAVEAAMMANTFVDHTGLC